MSQIYLDKHDLQKALDWARSCGHLPNEVKILGDGDQLRLRVENIDIGRFIPNISPEFSLIPSLDGQDLLLQIRGESLLSKFGGVMMWLISKTGFKQEGPLYKIESGELLRFRLGKITVKDQPLADFVRFTQVAWRQNRLELHFAAV